MGRRRAMLLVAVLVMCFAMCTVSGYSDQEQEQQQQQQKGLFMLQDSMDVFKTDAGDMKVVKGTSMEKYPMHIGFITMQPKTLFIPQYWDSNLVIFIRRGEAKLGTIYKDNAVEKQLRTGDVYVITAGSAFYIMNTGEGQTLHIICSIDSSQTLGFDTFQSFFIGGGLYPTSILSGFDPQTMATAFNVSVEELRELTSKQQAGPIVYLDTRAPSEWKQFLYLKEKERLAHLKTTVVHLAKEVEEYEEDEQPIWSIRKLLISLFGNENKQKKKEDKKSKSPKSFNIYEKQPDFKNNYGWSVAVDKSDYAPLNQTGTGIYLVNLTAGSMMAPHINPMATEYGIVLSGSGTIQIVFPNGTSAMNTEVHEGQVFWVPRFFPFCQIASRTAAFEFFGFTNSPYGNHPQFLVGSNSILKSMKGPEFAAAFGVSTEILGHIIDAQKEGVILPSAAAAPKTMGERKEEVIGNFVLV